MTEVNGLRLAYRGFVTGLAAAYVWAAVAMIVGWLLAGDALAPLRPFAGVVSPLLAGEEELAFVIGLAAAQAGGGLLGIFFAYFFGRFFTVRATLLAAAPAYALLAWALIAAGLITWGATPSLATSAAPLLATLAYGLLLGYGLPLRGEVLRPQDQVARSSSPST
jgi:hypothetical protein